MLQPDDRRKVWEVPPFSRFVAIPMNTRSSPEGRAYRDGEDKCGGNRIADAVSPPQRCIHSNTLPSGVCTGHPPFLNLQRAK
jgi:hypothetical protein